MTRRSKNNFLTDIQFKKMKVTPFEKYAVNFDFLKFHSLQ